MSPEVDLGVSRETHERLRQLVGLVTQWNGTIRLVGSATTAELWDRHVRDSLQLGSLAAGAPGEAVDVGSGAGFPGLVLAIALKRHFVLIEADRRKAAFLTEAARVTNTDVTIIHKRVQDVALTCQLLTARAFANVASMLEAVHHLLAPDAICLFPKGRNAEAELVAARPNWNMTVERHPSATDFAATILCIRQVSRV